MARFELLMPKLGESIIEATITKWLKKAGETVYEDDAIAEIATDKVDSEIPSPVEGVLEEILYKEGDVIPVGKVIAIINLGGEEGYTDYKNLSIKLGLTESSIRDYIGRLIKKGIPVEKTKINNKTIHLSVSSNLKKIASLPTILQLRAL